jgi:fermentation-respiration switch protein FrsA (DUF1100 family)
VRNALILALSALALFVGGSTWLALYPAVPADLGGVRNLDSEAKRVRIPVGDEYVDGWLLPGSDRSVVVLCAGYARDHRRIWRYAHFLKRDRHTLLAIDFRSGRAQRRRPTTLGAYEIEDASAVVAWVAAQPRWRQARIGLFGESLGGATVLAVAASHPEIEAVVADCPFATGSLAVRDGFTCRLSLPDWPFTGVALFLGLIVTGHDLGALDVRKALAALGNRPVLLIQTARGDRFSVEQVRALENAAGPGVEGWTVNDSRHTEVWVGHRREYEARVRAFFSRHLLGQRVWTLERADQPAKPTKARP